MTVESVAHATTSDAAELRARVAARIAAEVRHGHSRGETKITKVTSLLHAFRTTGSPTGIRSVVKDLQGEGLVVDSGWGWEGGEEELPVVRPAGVLELCPRSSYPQPSPSDEDQTIQVSIWTPGGKPSEECSISTDVQAPPESVLWFNVDPPMPTGNGAPTPDAFEARVREVAKRLMSWCPGLHERMVRDLLDHDVQPKVETYGDENDGVRGISVLAVIARETPGEPGDSDGVSEELVFQIVEIIIGDGWLVTCWHPSRIFIGTEEPESGHSVLREPFMSYVRYRWRDGLTEEPPERHKTSSDLAVYLSRALLATYEASHRMMERWVAGWEVSFYRSLSSSKKAENLKEAAGEISNLLSMVGEFRRRLTAFEHARWVTTDKTWFPNVSDVDKVSEEGDKSEQGVLASSLEAAEKSFELLSDTIRADINLLMLQNTATQQESTERLQRYLGKVTGLVLVPTLVVGFFGANTELPGRASWLGFEIMLVLMLLTGVVAYLALRRLSR